MADNVVMSKSETTKGDAMTATFEETMGSLDKTLYLMISKGEAPNYPRAKTLVTIMFGSNPTEEQLSEYRHSLYRIPNHGAGYKKAYEDEMNHKDAFEGLV
jgi:hypothetical protein